MSKTRDQILNRLHVASERFGLNPQQKKHIQRMALREEPSEVFLALYAVFENKPRPRYWYMDQEYAGSGLLASCPPCPLPLEDAIRRTLMNWDLSIEQLPLYFVEVFGKQQVLDSLARLSESNLSKRERDSVGAMRFWAEKHTVEWARSCI